MCKEHENLVDEKEEQKVYVLEPALVQAFNAVKDSYYVPNPNWTPPPKRKEQDET